jgi:hypothetical protein
LDTPGPRARPEAPPLLFVVIIGVVSAVRLIFSSDRALRCHGAATIIREDP